VRVVVTGAGGFVGSRVVRRLLAEGHDVAAIVRPTTSLERLEGVADQLTMLPGDIGAPASWRAALASWRPEACVHTAWYAEPGKYLDSTRSISALSHSLGLLEVLAEIGCRSAVMTGTCFEYDTDAGTLTEDTPVRPRTLYAACKLALSMVAAQRASQLGIHFAWARIFYVYGPYEDTRRLVPALILTLLRGERFSATTGEQVRDYIHVDDIASALVVLAASASDGVFNVCSAEPTTIRALMEEVGRLLGRGELIDFGSRPPARFEPAVIRGDNRRLRESTGWEPQRTLPGGLAETVEWWKSRARLPH
jgi:UDP-glucuronate decarboxylase